MGVGISGNLTSPSSVSVNVPTMDTIPFKYARVRRSNQNSPPWDDSMLRMVFETHAAL